MNKSGVFILYFILIPTNTLCFTFRSHYVYEFGNDKGNNIIYTYEGNINLLTPVTEKDIPILSDYDVTYVKVTVDSFSPPKVEYSSSEHRVSIVYSWLQISSSSYSITVKGVPHSKATTKHELGVKQIILHRDGNKNLF